MDELKAPDYSQPLLRVCNDEGGGGGGCTTNVCGANNDSCGANNGECLANCFINIF